MRIPSVPRDGLGIICRNFLKREGENCVSSMIVALIFNAIDYVTGLIGAIKEKTVNSTKLRDGLFKKIGFILCYFLSFLIDTKGYLVGINLDFDVLPFVVAYVVITEIVSICENIAIINPDIIPEKLLSLLHIQKGDSENGKN